MLIMQTRPSGTYQNNNTAALLTASWLLTTMPSALDLLSSHNLERTPLDPVSLARITLIMSTPASAPIPESDLADSPSHSSHTATAVAETVASGTRTPRKAAAKVTPAKKTVRYMLPPRPLLAYFLLEQPNAKLKTAKIPKTPAPNMPPVSPSVPPAAQPSVAYQFGTTGSTQLDYADGPPPDVEEPGPAPLAEDQSVATNAAPPPHCQPSQPVAEGQENAPPAATPTPKAPKAKALSKHPSTAALAATVTVQTSAISDIETKVVSFQGSVVDVVNNLASSVTANITALAAKVDSSRETTNSLADNIHTLSNSLHAQDAALRAHIEANTAIIKQWIQFSKDTRAELTDSFSALHDEVDRTRSSLAEAHALLHDEVNELKEEIRGMQDDFERESTNVRGEIFAMGHRVRVAEDANVGARLDKLASQVDDLARVVYGRPPHRLRDASPSSLSHSGSHVSTSGDENHPIDVIDSDEDSWKPDLDSGSEVDDLPSTAPAPAESPDSRKRRGGLSHATIAPPATSNPSTRRPLPIQDATNGTRTAAIATQSSSKRARRHTSPSLEASTIATRHSKRPSTVDVKDSPPKRARAKYPQEPRHHPERDHTLSPSPVRPLPGHDQAAHVLLPVPLTSSNTPAALNPPQNALTAHHPSHSTVVTTPAETQEDDATPEIIDLTTDQVVIKRLSAFVLTCTDRDIWVIDRRTNHLTWKSCIDLWEETAPPALTVVPAANLYISARATLFIFRNPNECWRCVHDFNRRPPGVMTTMRISEPPESPLPHEYPADVPAAPNPAGQDFLGEALARTAAARRAPAQRGARGYGRGRGGLGRGGVF